LKNLGYPADVLYQMGFNEHLATPQPTDPELMKINVQYPHMASDDAVLRAVALMIEENNRLISRQLRDLGLLKEF